MLEDAAQKYDPFPKLDVPHRKWPDRSLRSPPRWLATDLRDGNQALPEPMDGKAKLRYFQSLVELGYKEIEISYPSASQTEFDFTRHIATTPGLVPDDVWIQVMSPFREDLIRTTVEAARGASKVIVHLHVSTSECFRRIVFNKTEDEMVELVKRCTRLLRDLTKDSPDEELQRTRWVYEFTAENFQDTSVEYAVRICEAAKAAWEPTSEDKIIFNLPSTVEVAMPNIFADQIETFCESITEREKVCVSLHTHNDRGSAVAAAELGMLAGADRLEGCLFGNGERTGNVDLVTLAMNMYTQGISPGINFGDINEVVAMVEELTHIPLHFRAPYAGKFTFCTFTGVHQDAISKGYQRRALKEGEEGKIQKWEMPYLAMDPVDLGREHEAIIRLNSQSGKRGVSWLVKEVFGIHLPQKLEGAFTRIVQDHATKTGCEVTTSMIKDLFEAKFMLQQEGEPSVLSCNRSNDGLSERMDRSVDHFIRTNGATMRGNSTGGWTTPASQSGTEPGSADGTSGTNSNFDISTPVSVNGIDQVKIKSANGQVLSELVAHRLQDAGGDYVAIDGPGTEGEHSLDKTVDLLQATVTMQGAEHMVRGLGPDPTACALNAAKDLGFNFECLDHSTQIVETDDGPRRNSASFVSLAAKDGSVSWGVGIHEDPAWASLQAVLKASSQLAGVAC